VTSNSTVEIEEFLINIYSTEPEYKEFFPQIRYIKISKKKITIGIKDKFIGKFIGRKGENINSIQKRIREKFGSEWRVNLEDRISGSGVGTTPDGDIRTVILKQEFPLTVPFSSLKNEEIVSKFSKYIDNEGPILVTLFRDSMGKAKNKLVEKMKGTMGKIIANFSLQVMEKFPGKNFKILNWPDIHRSRWDTKRSTHPYISHRCRAAGIVSNKEIIDEEPFHQALFEAVHSEALSLSENKWVIVGDETGDLTEFTQEPTEITERWKSTMCWVVIPPSTKLKPLSSDFHCAGPDGLPDYIQGLTNLSKHESIRIFTFGYDEGEITKNASTIGQDAHLSFWQDTLPLVLEAISTEAKDGAEVDIFIEQVGGLESGIGIIQPIVAEFTSAFKDRKNWSNLQFDQLWVVSKGEHPWIGYPDVIGANINQKGLWGKDYHRYKKLASNIYNRINKSPYRQSSLNGPIRQALKDTAAPLVFLKRLSSISIEDQWDYIRVFFSEAIEEATSALRIHEWQDLNKHMKDTAVNEQGQKATQLILENCDCDAALEMMKSGKDILKYGKDRFELLMSMIGTANHKGDTKTAEEVKDRIGRLREEGYLPTRDRLLMFRNLYAGTFDNIFDFDKSIISLDQYLPDELAMEPIRVEREEDARYLGSKIVALGLRNQTGDTEQAIDISEVVMDYPDGDHWHIHRHLIYLSELLLQQERYLDAFEVLRERIEERCSFSRDENYSGGYYLAAMLKASYLTGKGEEEFQYAKDFVIKRLNSDSRGTFPSQRIVYWYTIWADALGLIDQASEAISFLESMAEKQWKDQNVEGVIISCELLDLKHRGLTEIDAETYLEDVLKNSHESTRKWVAKHPPNEEDWLAPLNFNYR
jgi:hypothetical protein